jgi:hypothetical protein
MKIAAHANQLADEAVGGILVQKMKTRTVTGAGEFQPDRPIRLINETVPVISRFFAS